MEDELLRAAVRLAISLPLVAVLAYGVIKYGLGRRAVGLRKQRRYLQVIEQLPLGPKIILSLIQVGDKYYVLAHQDGSTVLVTQLDHLPPRIQGAQAPDPGHFRHLITQKWGQREKKQP